MSRFAGNMGLSSFTLGSLQIDFSKLLHHVEAFSGVANYTFYHTDVTHFQGNNENLRIFYFSTNNVLL